MLFKELVVVTVPISNNNVIKINETNQFTIEHMTGVPNKFRATYYFHYCIKDKKGDFEIKNIVAQGNANVIYDKEANTFSVPPDCHILPVTFHIYVSAEFEESTHICATHELNISSARLKFLKPRQFYKDVIKLSGYENFTFTYFVKKIQEGTIELHIVNPYKAFIQGEAGEYKYETTDKQDIKLSLSFAFDPNKDASLCNEKVYETKKPVRSFNLYDIMSDKTYSDVTLVSSSGKEIPTFRCVLAKFSPIFKKVFEESDQVPLKHVIDEFDTETIEAALDFCYGKVDTTLGNESKLFEFAEKYCIRELKEACCTYLEQSLNTTNVCEIIKIAYANNFIDLKPKCKNYLVENKGDIDLDCLPKNITIDVLKEL